MKQPLITNISKVQINYEEIPVKNKLRSRSIYSGGNYRNKHSNDFPTNMVRINNQPRMLSVYFPSFLTTYYVIDGNYLIINSGFIVRMKIDINTVLKIVETYSIISSPATSLHRLNIIYNEHSSVLISPKDKSGFIAHITRINPQIVVQNKSRKKK